MTQADVLAQAAKSLREAHTGEREGSGFTRARILIELQRGQRRRRFRWLVFSPLASLLVVGSAWAQGTGQWPVVWRAVASVLAFTRRARPAPPEPSRAPRASLPAASPALLPQTAEVPSLAAAEPEASPGASDVERQTAPPERAAAPRTPGGAPRSAHTQRAQRPASPPASNADAPATIADTPSHPESKPDPDLALFRLAHDLHVAGRQPRAAVAAYDDYLAAFPHGRFVPEARYNRALDSIKLGDRAGARTALEAFARGAYGDYRRQEARELLEALR